MADFGIQNASELQTLGSGATLRKEDLQMVDLDISQSSGGENDFMRQMSAMAKQAQQQQGDDNSLQLNLDVDMNAITEAFRIDAKTETRLRDAKVHIRNKQHQKAKKLLAQVLEDHGDHHEAIYLTALCDFHLNQHKGAMKTIQRLKAMQPVDSLNRLADVLIVHIRNHMYLSAMLENMLLMGSQQYDRAALQLRDLITLDPECAMYHFMLAGSLMLAKKYDEAHRVAMGAADLGTPQENRQIAQVGAEIKRRWAFQQMAGARKLYKRGDYAKARSALRQVNNACKATPHWKIFDVYLRQLGGGMFSLFGAKRTPQKVEPKGEQKNVEALCAFLVEEEIEAAVQYAAKGRLDRANASLRTARKFVPFYVFLRFLSGFMTYRQLMESFQTGAPPEIAQAIKCLEEAAVDADFAARRKHPQAADLQRAVHSVLEQLLQVKATIASQQREAELVNPVIEEFRSIMKSADDGIRSARHFRDVNARMKKLKTKLPQVRRAVRSPEAVKALSGLTSAVDGNLSNLSKMEKGIEESEKVNDVIERFTTMMEALRSGGGITSRAQLVQTRTYFQILKSDAETLRRRAAAPESKKALDELLAAIGNVLSQ